MLIRVITMEGEILHVRTPSIISIKGLPNKDQTYMTYGSAGEFAETAYVRENVDHLALRIREMDNSRHD